MPRNVRNFWIELEVDGKQTKIATGPRSVEGGFSLRVRMRQHGAVGEDEVCLRGYANKGVLHLQVTAGNYELLERVTKR